MINYQIVNPTGIFLNYQLTSSYSPEAGPKVGSAQRLHVFANDATHALSAWGPGERIVPTNMVFCF